MTNLLPSSMNTHERFPSRHEEPERFGPFDVEGVEPYGDHMTNRLAGDMDANTEMLIHQANIDISLVDHALDEKVMGAEAYMEYADEESYPVHLPNLRVLRWKLTGNEKEIATIANWQARSVFKDPKEFDERYGYIQVPMDTRSAYGLFSGEQAWTGEKEEVVDWVINYIEAVRDLYPGQISCDSAFCWNQVGIIPPSKDQKREIFVAPPNAIKSVESVDDIEAWKAVVLYDLRNLLERDKKNIHLVEKFEKAIDRIYSHVA